MPELRLTFLGSFQASVDGEPVSGFLSNKVRALLAYLAVEDDRAHSRDRLAGLLWPESADQDARASLRTALANLRKVIQDRQAQPPFLETSVHSIRFRPGSSSWVDLRVFMDLTSSGVLTEDSALSQSKINAMERTVELCRGAFLEGFYLEDCRAFEEWVGIRREAVNRKLSEALHNLMSAYERVGDYRSALGYGRRHLELEPWDERTHQGVMRLLALSGNRSAALAQYQACQRLLAEELGVEPAPETIQIYRQIRDGELQAAVEKSSLSLHTQSEPPVRREALQAIQFPSNLQDQDGIEDDHPHFVARQVEMALLSSHLSDMMAGKGRAVFIQGEAGCGKTALLSEFTRRALGENHDLVAVKGRGGAFTGLGDPYQPFREALQMLSWTVGSGWAPDMISKENARRLGSMIPLTARTILEVGPGLIDSLLPRSELVESLRRSAPFDEDLLGTLEEIPSGEEPPDVLHHPALFEEITSLLQIISQGHPLILILDDLQWIDRGSAALLFHLGRHLAGRRIMILGAYRSYEIDRGWGGEEHPLKPVVQELVRMNPNTLVDLDQADGASFLEAWIANQPNRLSQGFRERLYFHTRGHPLFTIELLNDMQESGELIQDVEGRWVEGQDLDWTRIPERVEAVIAGRFERLPVDCQDILSGASVEGEQFTAEVLAQALHLPPQGVIDTLSGPLSKSHRLVEAQQFRRLAGQPLSQYRFRHSLFQKYFYQRLDPVERANLHQAVGEALEKIYLEGDDQIDLVRGPVAIRLARHFEAAGVESKAGEYLLLSGDYARQTHSYQAAIDYYQRALQVLRSLGDHESAARTLMKMGLMHHTLFQFNQAHKVYAEGFQLWQYASRPSTERISPASQPLRVEWDVLPTLDPVHAVELASGEVNDQLFCGLLGMNFEGELLPEAAASWQVLDDGCRYVFNLRENLCWSDGAQFTAKDFEFAWKRALLPPTGARYASLFYPIQGAREINQGKSSKLDSLGVRALDERTLQVDLVGPTSFFPYLVALPAFKPVPRHVIDRWGSAWTDVDKIQSNGPFRLLDWEEGHAAHFERSPTYTGEFTGNLEQVTLYLKPDWRDRLRMYQADQLDVLDATWLPPREAERVRLRHAGDYVSRPFLMTGYIGFNLRRPPFDDVRVRQALGMAVDKRLLADVIGRGHLPPATGGFVPPGMPGHVEGIGLPYNPGAARCLLAEAGYPDGRGLPQMEFLIYPKTIVMDLEFVRGQWQDNLGLNTEVKFVEFVELMQRLKDDPPHIHALFWIADYPDPESFLRASRFQTPAGWDNPAFERLVNQAVRAPDQEERLSLYGQAERLLIEDSPILPIIYGRHHLLLKPWVKKYPTYAWGSIHWKDVVLLRD